MKTCLFIILFIQNTCVNEWNQIPFIDESFPVLFKILSSSCSSSSPTVPTEEVRNLLILLRLLWLVPIVDEIYFTLLLHLGMKIKRMLFRIVPSYASIACLYKIDWNTFLYQPNCWCCRYCLYWFYFCHCWSRIPYYTELKSFSIRCIRQQQTQFQKICRYPQRKSW